MPQSVGGGVTVIIWRFCRIALCKVNWGNFVHAYGAILYLRDFCYTTRVIAALSGVLHSHQQLLGILLVRSIIAHIMEQGTRGYGIIQHTKLPRFTLPRSSATFDVALTPHRSKCGNLCMQQSGCTRTSPLQLSLISNLTELACLQHMMGDQLIG